MKKTWRITTYNKNNKVLDTWTIKDRTEKEAFNEAEADVNGDNKIHDWTMIEVIIRDVKFS